MIAILNDNMCLTNCHVAAAILNIMTQHLSPGHDGDPVPQHVGLLHEVGGEQDGSLLLRNSNIHHLNLWQKDIQYSNVKKFESKKVVFDEKYAN